MVHWIVHAPTLWLTAEYSSVNMSFILLSTVARLIHSIPIVDECFKGSVY